jgi:hypothetical protein
VDIPVQYCKVRERQLAAGRWMNAEDRASFNECKVGSRWAVDAAVYSRRGGKYSTPTPCSNTGTLPIDNHHIANNTAKATQSGTKMTASGSSARSGAGTTCRYRRRRSRGVASAARPSRALLLQQRLLARGLVLGRSLHSRCHLQTICIDVRRCCNVRRCAQTKAHLFQRFCKIGPSQREHQFILTCVV